MCFSNKPCTRHEHSQYRMTSAYKPTLSTSRLPGAFRVIVCVVCVSTLCLWFHDRKVASSAYSLGNHPTSVPYYNDADMAPSTTSKLQTIQPSSISRLQATRQSSIIRLQTAKSSTFRRIKLRQPSPISGTQKTRKSSMRRTQVTQPSTVRRIDRTQPATTSRTQTTAPSSVDSLESSRPSIINNDVSRTNPASALGAESHCTPVVPRILHLAWYGSKTRPAFRFHHVVSVMSSLRFIQPQHIMFWYDRVPTGKWWTFIRQKINKTTTTLMMMQRDAPKTIFGRPVYQDEHHSDIVRLEAVMKYGGIYHDLDVVVLRPLGRLYCYQTTMGEELPNWLCNGFFMSVANATFLRLWYESYRTFKSNQWNYHSVQMPGIIAREHPGLVHVEKDTIHKPNWQDPGLRKLYNDGVFYNWTARNYAVHLWYRKHNVDYDPESIKRLNKTVGQIFRYIFYGQYHMIR